MNGEVDYMQMVEERKAGAAMLKFKQAFKVRRVVSNVLSSVPVGERYDHVIELSFSSSFLQLDCIDFGPGSALGLDHLRELDQGIRLQF